MGQYSNIIFQMLCAVQPQYTVIVDSVHQCINILNKNLNVSMLISQNDIDYII